MKLMKMSVCVILLMTIPVLADTADSLITVGRRIKIESEILGESRNIDIALPAGYEAGGENYGVVYVLDANVNFTFTASMIQYLSAYDLLPPLIVVGVENISRATRNRDFTSTAALGGAARRYPTAGGADSFLAFLSNELIPHIDAGYRTLPFRMLIGHSLGGLFCGHVLMKEPQLFKAILAVSPSFWWNSQEPVQQLKSFFIDHTLDGCFFRATLADEGDEEDTATLRNLCDYLDEHSGADAQVTFRSYADYNHASTVVPATLDMLSDVYDGLMPDWSVIQSGLKALEAHYEKLSRRLGYDVPLTRDRLHQAACSALVGGLNDLAIEMLESNRQKHPEWPASYSILSEAWEAKNDFRKALDWAEAALKLDPESEKLRRRVDSLKKKGNAQ